MRGQSGAGGSEGSPCHPCSITQKLPVPAQVTAPPAVSSTNRGYLGESMEQNLDDSQPLRSSKPGFKSLPCLTDLCDLGHIDLGSLSLSLHL